MYSELAAKVSRLSRNNGTSMHGSGCICTYVRVYACMDPHLLLLTLPASLLLLLLSESVSQDSSRPSNPSFAARPKWFGSVPSAPASPHPVGTQNTKTAFAARSKWVWSCNVGACEATSARDSVGNQHAVSNRVGVEQLLHIRPEERRITSCNFI